MLASRQKVLVIGLILPDRDTGTVPAGGKFNKQMVHDDISNARTADYDCTVIDINPIDQDPAKQELQQKLQAQQWDLFVIGFGIRGNRAFTTLFEEIVNACVESSPGTRFGFAPTPDGVCRTILRVLPPQ
ncbi:hypothetical protein CKM354_001112400 [Cercospora kikuchii]|uniref:Uncharacterized protein n=1 Tax=Cercospora kikuchii TaxID=84275 RepID=A0A9P3CSD1_9PEZI|nr:uncharacterized protein CKM354_001112400 [Cercospora kikuchii]GIZ48049.1 hypothetical protein CKM354_001112400 [Cercospora kikuchii]